MSTHLKYWLPAILIAVLISAFSTKYFSGENTARVIFPILRWLYPGITRHTLHLLHFLIRKAAHITEFATLSIAVFHGVRGERSGWRIEWALWTLVIVLVLSSTVGLYYYLRILFTFFVKQPEPQGPVGPEQAISLSGTLTLAALTFLLIWLGIMPAPIFDLIQTMVH